MELHLHAAVLIGVDLFARGTDDDCRLAALHERLRGNPLGTEWRGEGNALERVLVGEFFAAVAAGPTLVVVLGGDVTDCGQEICLVQVRAIVIFQRELKAAAEMPATARTLTGDARRGLLLQTDARQLVAFAAHA